MTLCHILPDRRGWVNSTKYKWTVCFQGVYPAIYKYLLKYLTLLQRLGNKGNPDIRLPLKNDTNEFMFCLIPWFIYFFRVIVVSYKREIEWKDVIYFDILRDIFPRETGDVFRSASLLFSQRQISLRRVSTALNFQGSRSDASCNFTDKFSNSLLFIYSKMKYFSFQTPCDIISINHYILSVVVFTYIKFITHESILFTFELPELKTLFWQELISWSTPVPVCDFCKELHLTILNILHIICLVYNLFNIWRIPSSHKYDKNNSIITFLNNIF